MRGKTWRRCVIALLLAAAAASSSLAAPASAVGGHDIGALLQRAGAAWDLDGEDEVLLLDSVREDWTADGRRVHSVHRIVYVRTGLAIWHHADLRVPYDQARQRFSVTALRTWRLSDRRWTESGPTAQVETLPFALERAPDYGSLREMMLLHDGVELPCVLETAYTIEDIEPFRPGAEGLWVFARSGPVVVSRAVLGFPAGAEPVWAAGDGVPRPARGRDAHAGLETLTFEMGPLDPSPGPPAPDAFATGPRIAWSTWKGWAELGRDLLRRFDAAMEVGEELDGRLAEHLEKARSEGERAARVAGFIAETTRAVDYTTGWWPGPRSAARTWSTAYAAGPDRVALGAALFRRAGLRASLAFRGRAPGDVDPRVPGLDWADGPGLWIEGDEVEGWFDAASATLSRGPASLDGLAVWRPGVDDRPVVRHGEGDPSRIDVKLDLRYDAETAVWSGGGVLAATGVLCPFDRMAGLGTEAHDYLALTAASLLSGATVTGYNPEAFGPSRVTVGFAIELPAGERDGRGRLRLAAAAPGEIAALLERAAVHVWEERRGSEVRLPAAIEQRIELHLDPGDLDLAYLPQPVAVENGAGRFTLVAAAGEGGITLSRSLVLRKSLYATGEWPELRALLLADADERSRLLLLK